MYPTIGEVGGSGACPLWRKPSKAKAVGQRSAEGWRMLSLGALRMSGIGAG